MLSDALANHCLKYNLSAIARSHRWPTRTDSPKLRVRLGHAGGVNWSTERLADVVHAHRELWVGEVGSDREERRALLEEHGWVDDVVRVVAMGDNGSEGDVIELLDALLTDARGHEEYEAYVGAGPLEQYITQHPEPDFERLSERVRTDTTWASAMGCVWLDRRHWEALPESLRSVVHEPPKEMSKAQRKRRRPSKRLGRTPRRG